MRLINLEEYFHRSNLILPDLPVWFFARPECFKFHFIPDSVHTFPEAGMRVRRKLPVMSYFDQRFFLPLHLVHVSFKIFEYARFQYKKSSIDPHAVGGRFFLEMRN